MCNQCDDPSATHSPEFTLEASPNRRNFLISGAAALAAAPLGSAAAAAVTQGRGASAVTGERIPAVAWGVTSARGEVQRLSISRRPVGPGDVLMDVLYSGICHSDIHTAHSRGPAPFPRVPGHEIIGRVRGIGRAVTRFRAGDIVGVGTMVDSCGICANCRAERHQNCLNADRQRSGTTFTYSSEDRHTGENTLGGYSDRMVVNDRFVFRIPHRADLPSMAPVLCAGVTTYSPLRHWQVKAGQRVGVVGLGGLGHLAVKLANALGAEVTAFTTTRGKLADATRLGARHAFLWTDTAALNRLANSFDLILAAVPQPFPLQPFIDLLKLDATLVNVGALGELQGVNGLALVMGRKRLAGSLVGGVAETQELIDLTAARNIKADVELIRPDQINQAWERVVNKDVRYRFVIDFTGAHA